MDSDPDNPRISFGIIVLNGEPFMRHTLRALYPHAHQILVAEGAAPGAAVNADEKGHSRDHTLETVRAFQQSEDPQGKVTLITAESEGHPDGFWPGEKHEQSQAYARRATGDYLWQVDVDEFYLPEDIERVRALLRKNPGASGITFPTLTFWGALNCVVDGWYLRRGAGDYHRLFRWGPGYEYITHRPPTVKDAEGRDLRDLNWLEAGALRKVGVIMRHYSLLFPRQVREKCAYYTAAGWNPMQGFNQWAEQAYFQLGRPTRVHNVYEYPSWLERYDGPHPPEVLRMMEAIGAGDLTEPLRATEDIQALLRSPAYALRRLSLQWGNEWDLAWHPDLDFPQARPRAGWKGLTLPFRALRRLARKAGLLPNRRS